MRMKSSEGRFRKMMLIGKITADLLAQEWRIKKALRGCEASQRELHRGDASPATHGDNNVYLFPARHREADTLRDAAQFTTGCRGIGGSSRSHGGVGFERPEPCAVQGDDAICETV